jgi:hypothetical protein
MRVLDKIEPGAGRKARVKILRERLRNPRSSPATRRDAADAMCLLSPAGGVQQDLVTALGDPDLMVRDSASRSLLIIDEVFWTTTQLKRLNDRNTGIRVHAATQFGAMRSKDPKVWQALVTSAVHDTDDAVWKAAMQSLRLIDEGSADSSLRRSLGTLEDRREAKRRLDWWQPINPAGYHDDLPPLLRKRAPQKKVRPQT